MRELINLNTFNSREMQLGRIKAFVSRHIVVFTIIPMIVGMHYGWFWLQNCDTLNERNIKRETFPLTDVSIYYLNYIT